MKDNVIKGNTIVLRTIPQNLIRRDDNKNILFKATDLNLISEDLNKMLVGLKKINFEILVRQKKEGLEIIAISPSDLFAEDDIRQTFDTIMKNTTSMVELVKNHASSMSSTSIFLPQDLKLDPERNIPPTVKNGILIIKNNNELQQLIDIEKIIKQRSINLGDACFEQIQSPNPFLINEDKKSSEKIELKFVEFLSTQNIKASKIIRSEPEKLSKPIKVDFSEQIIKSKKYLELVKHSLYVTKNRFIVNGEITSSYDVKNGTIKIEKILITEILDFGLGDYKDEDFIWKNNSQPIETNNSPQTEIELKSNN